MGKPVPERQNQSGF